LLVLRVSFVFELPRRNEFIKVAQLSQRDRAAGWISFGIFNYFHVSVCSAVEFGEIMQHFYTVQGRLR